MNHISKISEKSPLKEKDLLSNEINTHDSINSISMSFLQRRKSFILDNRQQKKADLFNFFLKSNFVCFLISFLLIFKFYCLQYDIYIMFVNSTLLGLLDRQSIKSILTSATGSILGFLGTLVFFVLCFILFLGPLQLYFRGDFIEASFITSKSL